MWPPSIKLKMLIAIAILPLLLFDTKQTSAQAKTNYGLGGYAMDDKKMVMVPEYAQLLKTADDVKSYKTNKQDDTQFKPCRVELDKNNNFEVFYDEDAAKEGCTVDFVMDKIDEITTRIKVADKKMGCLEDCGKNEKAASSKNMVPFTYSMSNEDIKNLHSGPPYNEDQMCDEECAESGGKCMASATSLQIAWTKCAKGSEDGEDATVRARAWIQLVGEPVTEWSAEIIDEPEENSEPGEIGEYPDEAHFQLSIKMGDNPEHSENKLPLVPLFNVTGTLYTDRFLYKEDSDGKFIYPDCFLNDTLPMIPVPKFWAINSDNADLKGKHLLVFHLLPQKATRIFDEEGKLQNDQPPASGMPKCMGKLSIIFENVAGLLQSSELSPSTIGPTEATGEGIGIEIILAIVGGVVLLLIIFAALMWFFCCRDKDSDKGGDEDAETGSDEDKERILLDSCITPAETRCE